MQPKISKLLKKICIQLFRLHCIPKMAILSIKVSISMLKTVWWMTHHQDCIEGTLQLQISMKICWR